MKFSGFFVVVLLVAVYGYEASGHQTSAGFSGSQLATDSDRKALLEKKYFLFDLDGTIYVGSKLIPGVDKAIQWLQANGKKIMFVTNSGSKTAAEYHTKLTGMGLNITVDQIYSAGMATAEFMSRQSKRKTAFILGGAGIHHYMKQAGFTHTDQNPEYVLVGSSKPTVEFGDWTYALFQKAMQLVQAGSILMTSSPDLEGVDDHGAAPGVGAMAAVIEAATGKKAYSVGKPNAYMLTEALLRMGGTVEAAVMVGDNLDTDIVGALNSGMDGLFVLTGRNTEADIAERSFRPSFILRSVADIVPPSLAGPV